MIELFDGNKKFDVKLYARATVTIFLIAFLFTTGTRLADYVWILLFGQ